MKNMKFILLIIALLTVFSVGVFATEVPISETEITATTTPVAPVTTIEEIRDKVLAEVDNAKGNEIASLQAGAVILADPVTKNIIYELNADKKMFPASTTKLMSFVVIYEGIKTGKFNLSDPITISPAVEAVTEGDLDLVAGEVWTLQELLYAMSIISANDAAVAVAEYAAGTEAQYVEMMNAKAAELGMTNTHFVTSSGLHDENHYTTARDLLTLSYFAVDMPELLALTSTENHVFKLAKGQVTLHNTNKLLLWYPGSEGLKTGFTTPAGHCLVGTTVKDNMRLISVVLGEKSKTGHYSDSMKLLNYGFSKYSLADAVIANKTLKTIDLPKGKTENIEVTAKDTITLPTAKEGDPGYKIEYKMDSNIVAPVEKGDVIGKIIITANGSEIASTHMLAAESMEKENIFQASFRYIRDFFRKITT